MESRNEIIPVKVSDSVTVMVEATALGGEEDVGVGEILDFQGVTDAVEAIAEVPTQSNCCQHIPQKYANKSSDSIT